MFFLFSFDKIEKLKNRFRLDKNLVMSTYIEFNQDCVISLTKVDITFATPETQYTLCEVDILTASETGFTGKAATGEKLEVSMVDGRATKVKVESEGSGLSFVMKMGLASTLRNLKFAKCGQCGVMFGEGCDKC